MKSLFLALALLVMAGQVEAAGRAVVVRGNHGHNYHHNTRFVRGNYYGSCGTVSTGYATYQQTYVETPVVTTVVVAAPVYNEVREEVVVRKEVQVPTYVTGATVIQKQFKVVERVDVHKAGAAKVVHIKQHRGY
jgi:hypothetical protein